MLHKPKHIIATLLLLMSLAQCKDPYTSPYQAPKTGYLVVEGYITDSKPKIKLSRTIPLAQNPGLVSETNAVVQVEGDDNSTYLMTETNTGVYGLDTLPLKPAVKYRLRVHTVGNKDYLSDFVPYKITPAIDSVNWIQDNNGVDIYVNTHDASNNTRYYQWEYEETWHYTSAKFSSLVFTKTKPWVVGRKTEDQIFDCYRDVISTAFLLGTSTKLSEDIIYRQPLTHIQRDAQQLALKYSMLVKQYALSEDAYNYLSMMAKNTQSLGSIFDAQPSYLKGNIHNTSDAKEQVIGFVTAGSSVQTRLWIDRAQLPLGWGYSFACQLKDSVIPLDSSSIWQAFQYEVYIPIEYHYNFGMLDGYSSNGSYCIDCRTQGGTTQRPSFWPN